MDFPRKGKQKMKKLIYVLSALAALSLVAPSAGFAQAYNQIGVYLDDEATVYNHTMAGTGQLELKVIVTHAYNQNTVPAGVPVTQIAGFEAGLLFEGTAGIFRAAVTYPTSAVNVGNDNNLLVGYDTPLLVSGDATLLCSLPLFTTSVGTMTVKMTPASPASIAGLMAIADKTVDPQELVPMYPSSGDFDMPVFALNIEGGIVDTEDTSFDNIKAMYR
jgi:hypothetical protein